MEDGEGAGVGVDPDECRVAVAREFELAVEFSTSDMGSSEADIAHLGMPHDVANLVCKSLDVLAHDGAGGIRSVDIVEAVVGLVDGNVVGEGGGLVDMHELETVRERADLFGLEERLHLSLFGNEVEGGGEVAIG